MAILFPCLHEHHAINAQVGVQIILHIFLTPDIDSSVCSVSFSAQALYPWHRAQVTFE